MGEWVLDRQVSDDLPILQILRMEVTTTAFEGERTLLSRG